MRERLSWDKEKTAEVEKKADPYTMNQDHKNPPVNKYDIGGPSEFAESPDTKTPWKNEGRAETGHPKSAASPERDAVKAAAQIEERAIQCITVAQRMLPGASDDIIEEQATDLMFLPDKCIMATLQRQAQLAESLVAQDEEEPKPAEEKKPEEEKKPVEAKKEEKKPEEEKKPVEAKKEEKKPEEEKPVVEAKKEEKKPEEEKPVVEAKKEEKKPEEEEIVEASEPDLLDNYFTTVEKTGAKKLSGIVKQASTGDVDKLLWSAPPDVSEAFNLKR